MFARYDSTREMPDAVSTSFDAAECLPRSCVAPMPPAHSSRSVVKADSRDADPSSSAGPGWRGAADVLEACAGHGEATGPGIATSITRLYLSFACISWDGSDLILHCSLRERRATLHGDGFCISR